MMHPLVLQPLSIGLYMYAKILSTSMSDTCNVIIGDGTVVPDRVQCAVSNKNIQTYVLLETVASIYVIYVSYSSYLYDMIIRSNTGTYLIVATVGVVPHMFQIGGYRKKDVYVAKKMIQISHSHKIHRPTMTNGNSSDISTLYLQFNPQVSQLPL